MSESFIRAKMLREHRRHDEAVAMLHQHLAGDPQHAEAHIELALNRMDMPGQRTLALDDVRRAIAIAPDSAGYHVIHAIILSQLDREDAALAAAEEALAIDPEHDGAWYAKALAHTGKQEWKDAEAAIRQALALDPDDASYSNLLAQILRMQNRLDESEAEVRRRLAHDPENAGSFASAGWTALQRHQPKEAEAHFLEALRLDPEFKYARIGLRESYKARSFLYRVYLRWAFFLQRYSEKQQWLIFIGLYVGFKLGRVILTAVHPIAAAALVLIYLFLAFGSWLANGLGHFLLLKDPRARMSLERREKLDGLAVGSLFLTGLALLTAGVTVLPLAYAICGAIVMGSALPAGQIFTNHSRPGRFVFSSMTLLILFAAVQIPLGSSTSKVSSWISIALFAIVASTWFGMIPKLRKGDPNDA